ncbi:sugar ABC transporter substrate-binding protein [Halolactibacillus alkaliphilus]|uniref:Sugar ABC transporter substrate-binding protein n=1 Tax=Halolactibacillus alkaliphilus TaxID=442899 RepID=A0A511WZN8_9BACI|nr:sugar ABC transporter substrate-binding protein [Halolactibacillus alkaliphilus]GEN56163.1 sugar ABC transporter substrate-binding protein [Halolactibacillus alkaliphilus]GGN66810.1 sugar ABC transporter substrate-binding protein [Halolactibacillus alkaliphilus]SFO72096.1 putative chitobiose transport system substrate-binding protein [Halolactibacillus alkaliphilus]
MKKTILLLLMALFAMFVVACGSDDVETGTEDNDSVDTEQDTDQDETTELSGDIEFMTIDLMPTFEEYLNGVIADFNEVHPNVNVTIRDVPLGQVEQVVLTSAAGDQLPDVMNLNTDFLKRAGALGAFVNMDEKASHVKDHYFEGLWNAGEVNGSVYALPWYTTTSSMLYNPELLEAAGFDGPPSTYEEGWEMSKAIYEETGAYGNLIDSNIHLHFPRNGIDLLNAEGTAATFNVPEAVELWEEYKELYDEGLFPADVMLNQQPISELYAQEKVAWWITGAQLFGQINDLAPEVYNKSLAAEPIVGTAGVTVADTMNIAVSSKSDNVDAAVEFAIFLTNDQNQLAFAHEATILPSTIEAANDEFFSVDVEEAEVSQAGRYYAAQSLENAVNMSPAVENTTEIYEVIRQAFQRVILEDVEPSDALADAEEQVNALLQ